MEQLDYNLLYRWFVGLNADGVVWLPTTFTKNRERLQQGDIFQRFTTVLLAPQSEAALIRRTFLGRWDAD